MASKWLAPSLPRLSLLHDEVMNSETRERERERGVCCAGFYKVGDAWRVDDLENFMLET